MNREKIAVLYKKYGLEESDVFKHQHYLIITRAGIDKIQAKEKIAINYEIWIKPHPNNQIELGKYPKLKAKCTDLTLLELFQLTHVALTTVFTSAALDAFCCGIPVINYLDPDDFNLSNLRGIECTKFVSTENELFQALEQIEFSDHKKGKPEDFFWLEPELPKWKELLKGEIISQLENVLCQNQAPAS